MAKINPDLLKRMQEVLGLSGSALYRQIQLSNSHALERNLAALAFALEKKIGINRFSTSQERAELRDALAGRSRAVSASTVSSTPPPPKVRTSAKAKSNTARKSKADGTIFVVHGRNEMLRKSVFDFLRCIGLKPVEWEKAVLKARGGNPFIEDVLRENLPDANAIVVLFTPDDEARLKDEFCGRGEKTTEGKLKGQPRQNVIFEAGWAVGRFPEKTLLVQVGKIRSISDISGRHILHLGNEPDKRNAFAKRLENLGCKIDLAGSDWTRTGDFRA